MTLAYSVVIPVYNEEENLSRLVDEIETVMSSLNKPWELICVDDGSKDGSKALIKNLAKSKPFLRLIAFEKNSGQSSAFDAGFRLAKGDFIITLDADLQNDPKDIPKLIAEADAHDLVVGWRVNRQDRWHRKAVSRLSNWIRSRLCRDGIHDTGCSLKVYRKSCFDKVKMFTGMHRFLPALFRLEGFSIKEVPVSHRERAAGKSKYHLFNRSIGPILDMLVVRWMWSRKLPYTVAEDLQYKEEKEHERVHQS